MFQSTHSLRSATISGQMGSACGRGFNPRTPCGVRRPTLRRGYTTIPFQSTHSLRSATVVGRNADARQVVSIHALLAECDRTSSAAGPSLPGFNPRTPCGVRHVAARQVVRASSFNPRTPCGVRLFTGSVTVSQYLFQSTHSLRSATRPASSVRFSGPGFNPRTPCGVRPESGWQGPPDSGFQSTHSLRSATCARRFSTGMSGFQSTHSLRSATRIRPRCRKA